MGALQPYHLLVVLVIVLLIFGPGKLPELGRALGDGIRELKRATDGDHAATPAATPTPLQAAATRPCPHCAAAVPLSDHFCGACGTPIVASSATLQR